MKKEIIDKNLSDHSKLQEYLISKKGLPNSFHAGLRAFCDDPEFSNIEKKVYRIFKTPEQKLTAEKALRKIKRFFYTNRKILQGCSVNFDPLGLNFYINEFQSLLNAVDKKNSSFWFNTLIDSHIKCLKDDVLRKSEGLYNSNKIHSYCDFLEKQKYSEVTQQKEVFREGKIQVKRILRFPLLTDNFKNNLFKNSKILKVNKDSRQEFFERNFISFNKFYIERRNGSISIKEGLIKYKAAFIKSYLYLINQRQIMEQVFKLEFKERESLSQFNPDFLTSVEDLAFSFSPRSEIHCNEDGTFTKYKHMLNTKNIISEIFS